MQRSNHSDELQKTLLLKQACWQSLPLPLSPPKHIMSPLLTSPKHGQSLPTVYQKCLLPLPQAPPKHISPLPEARPKYVSPLPLTSLEQGGHVVLARSAVRPHTFSPFSRRYGPNLFFYRKLYTYSLVTYILRCRLVVNHN